MNEQAWFLISLLALIFSSSLSEAFSALLKLNPEVFEDRKKTRAERFAAQWPREWAVTLALMPYLSLTALLVSGAVALRGLFPVLGGNLFLWIILSLLALSLVTFFRSLAERHSFFVIRIFGWIYLLFFFLLYPLSSLLSLLMSSFGLAGGLDLAGPVVSTREIQDFVETGEGSDYLEKDEREMISSVIDFHDTQVHEVMIPRIDIKALDLETSHEELRDFVSSCGHSRIPVYRETIDNVVGILYSKDLLALRGQEQSLEGMLREAYFVPESKPIGDLLRRFQEKRQHMAVVVDEYGGTEGIVTLEDLLEEIVGEIRDEHDPEESLFELLDKNRARVDAKIDLDELGEILSHDFEESESYESLGGLMLFHAGRLLKPGDEVRVEPFAFRVESVQRQRIAKVILIREGLSEGLEKDSGKEREEDR